MGSVANPYYKTRKEQKKAVQAENASTVTGVAGLGASLASKHSSKVSASKHVGKVAKAGKGLGAASIVAAVAAAHHVVKRDKIMHAPKKTVRVDAAKAATGWTVQPPHPSNHPKRTKGNKGSH